MSVTLADVPELEPAVVELQAASVTTIARPTIAVVLKRLERMNEVMTALSFDEVDTESGPKEA